MAVVLLATYSCVQDTTEDLAPVVSGPVSGSGEVKTLQVALPNPTRTELGELAEGKYPVFWSEGDVIAVNGKPTTNISIKEDNKSVAVFDLPLGVTIPYNVVYPYPGENVSVNSDSGKYPVVFMTNQHHTEGTFAKGAAPMYSWSDGFHDIEMHHLSTVLRFSVKAKAGENVSLKYVAVSTVDAVPIAGVFDVYCGSNDKDDKNTGSLEAREGASSTVFYNFENDEFVLSEEESVFYIAVPYGSYPGGFQVNFVAKGADYETNPNSGCVFTRTFKGSGDDVLNPGKVRHFPTIEFDYGAAESVLLIGSDVEMMELANKVAAETFNDEYKGGALLVADVDMTDKGLKTIDNFTSVLEGRHYTISGLTEPLFGENTTAQILNLNVAGNIVEQSNGQVGLIARSLAAGGRVFNCSAAGSIEYENPNVAINSEDFTLVNVGGAVGGVYGAEVSIVKSDVDITVKVAGPEGNTAYNPCFGGVVGYACASGEALPTVTECSSTGDVIWNDASGNSKVTPFIGGVAGYVTDGTFSDNTNAGKLEIHTSMYDLDWGGVIGASLVSVERCKNKGSMTINQEVTKANIGGVIGQLSVKENESYKNTLVDCENSGEVNLNESFKIVDSANIGGVAAEIGKNTSLVKGCYNSGSITYLGECVKRDKDQEYGNTIMHLGGVAGICWSEVAENCGNKASGIIEVRGKVAGSGVNGEVEDMTGLGGVFGARLGLKTSLGIDTEVSTTNCSNEGTVNYNYTYCGKGIVAATACIGVFDSDKAEACSNSGDMHISTIIAPEYTGQKAFYISAVMGYIKSPCSILQCNNSGTLEYNNSKPTTIYMSAINSYCGASGVNIEGCSNSGDVIVGEGVECTYLELGGVIATTKYLKEAKFPNISNSGKVIAKCMATEEAWLGGIFGESGKGTNTDEVVTGVQNTGEVTFSGTSKQVCIGGYAGYYRDSKHTVQFKNASSGVLTFNGRATKEAFIGGYIGMCELDTPGKMEAFNESNIVVKGLSPNLYVAGCIGYAKRLTNTGLLSGLRNTGTIELPDVGEATEFSTNAYLGGVVAWADFGVTGNTEESSEKPTTGIAECYNEGELHYNSLVTDGAYIGGIVAKASKTPIYNCVNNGKIISTGNAGSLVSRLKTSADRVLAKVQLHYHDIAIGGVVAETDANVLSSSNEATIEHTCNPNPLKIDQWSQTASSRFDIGGVVGRTYVKSDESKQYAITLAGLTNKERGEITIYGSPYCTNSSSSIQYADDNKQEPQSTDIDDPDRANMRPFYRMNLAGVVGRLHDHSNKDVKHYLNNCQNSALVSVPDAPYAKNLNMAGVVADILSSYTTLTSCSNSGTLRVDNAGYGIDLATNQVKHCYFINMGGVASLLFDVRVRSEVCNTKTIHKTLTFNQCSNSGNIYYGENLASFGISAGGMLAQALNWLTAQSKWAGWGDVYTYIPMNDVTITMNQCENRGNVTYYSKAMNNLKNYTGTSFAGGMVGSCGQANNAMNHQARFTSIDLLLNGCKNYGNIQFDRSNGSMSPNSSVNYSAVGGLVGLYFGSVGTECPSYTGTRSVDNGYRMEITSGENHGRIWGVSGYIGGIVGRANWYVKITGTEAEPTINTGDVVVARNASAGNAVRRTGYGNKIIHAGGIAGALWEQYTDTRFMGLNSGNNEGWPAYTLGSQYCRVEHAINKGTVGATTIAGGIVGEYRCFYAPTKELAPSRPNKGGIENCTNLGDIYALEGATSNVGSIVGSSRTMTITEYSSYKTNETAAVAAKTWPVGVFNCTVGGTILRGANRYTTADADNFMNCIYGEAWDSTATSLVEGKGNEYDGCRPYTVAEEGGEGEEPMAVRR